MTRAVRVLAWSCAALVASITAADDIGITNARLLEQDDAVYVLEVEAHPNVVGWITPPVFPERFELRDVPEPEWNGSIVTLRYVLASPSGRLRTDDVVVLPWQRSAALITARWSDGTVRRGLFTRGMGGIRVPIAELRDDRPSLPEVAGRNFRGAFVDAGARWGVIALLAVALSLAATSRTLATRLAAFAGGCAVAMVAIDLGSPAIPGTFAIAGLGLGAAVLGRVAVREADSPAGALSGAIGLVAGLGVASGVAPGPERIAALFGQLVALAGITAALALAAQLLVVLVPARLRNVLAYAVGVAGAAIALFLVFAAPPPEVAVARDPAFELGRAMEPGAGATSLPPTRPPAAPVDAVTLFVTVEPFEVRVEALVRIDGWVVDREILAIADQPAVADELASIVLRDGVVAIDGVAATPDAVRTDYVAIGPFGVQTRDDPIPEPVANGLLGVTLAFSTAAPPTSVDVTWGRFDTTVARVPATWSDPGAVDDVILTPDAPSLAWRGDVSAFAPPPVEAIAVAPAIVPAPSIVLALGAAVGWLAFRARPGVKTAAWIAIAVAVALYPFARTPVPGWTAPAPDASSAARIAQPLLTNVYRAFDVRAEDAIYDRLAVSVTGEQLTDAYLEHRRALELENRGGARARVDDVDVLRVRSVRPVENGGFVADVSWTVSGSVGHFGHIHYRRNRYRAELTIVPVDGTWKIGGVDIRDEQRIL